MLDTNAYCLFFDSDKGTSFENLERYIKDNDEYIFYISEITSLEIYSVIGKMQRGIQPQQQKCSKIIDGKDEAAICGYTWYSWGQKKLNKNLFKDIAKLLSDIENQRSYIKADVLYLSTSSIIKGKQFLKRYSHKYKFGSQDAMIVGSLIQAKEEGIDLALVTSDRSLIATLTEDQIPYFDPIRNESFVPATTNEVESKSVVG